MATAAEFGQSLELIDKWKRDPIAFVIENFGATPDPFQALALEAFPHKSRIAMKAAKGPGKTCVLAWMVLNFLATRSEAQVACISSSGDNLRDGLWKELSKWINRCDWLKAKFKWRKTLIENLEMPGTWYCSKREWSRSADPQAQSDTLSGLHSDNIMFILDESSSIPQGIMTTAEAVLATGYETKIVQAGNPTHLTGPLYRACVNDRHLWHVVEINGDPDDPNRSTRIDIEWARQQIATYGRDNPWVMVNVLGQFPPSSLNALLGPEDVNAAMERHLTPDQFEWAQKRLGVDVARFGDDRTVIFPRQGRASFRPHVMRHQRTTDIAAQVMKASREWSPEVILIDDTGHWGHGVIDNLYAAKLDPIGIIFNAPALDPRYKNRRAEMWLTMAEWVKHGAALPPIPELVAELVEPTYTFVGGQFMLEDKDQIKKRLGTSPDLADALACTFAIPDQPAAVLQRLSGANTVKTEFDPWR